MAEGRWFRNTILVLVVLISVILEMCFYKKLFKKSINDQVVDHIEYEGPQAPNWPTTVSNGPDGYLSGLYYSSWSPYPPRTHFPHDIDFTRISHIYYAFFLVDGATGAVKNGDEWSDFGMDLYKPMSVMMDKLNYSGGDPAKTQNEMLPNGCLGELFYLRHTNMFPDPNTRNFKLIMCVGGWSNRGEFPKLVKHPGRIEQFANSCIDTMFKYGFDGIDLDWEFPEDDNNEPQQYLEIARILKAKMGELENHIFGSTPGHPKFQLSVATPAFSEKLKILPIKEMDRYVDIWNMMTYDYYGEWSERTGYHSNLFDGSGKRQSTSNQKHMYLSDDGEGLNGDSAIRYMVEIAGVDSKKLSLGMAAYGRGFTNVEANRSDSKFIDKKFRGVGGALEGEPGMWPYNQLPVRGSQEVFDPEYGSAFCYHAKQKTFVGYDNVDSVRMKAQYVKEKNLAGGFWWESCGDDHQNPSRSLLNAFTNEAGSVRKFDNLMYHQRPVLQFYIEKFGKDGYLSPFLERILQDEKSTA